MAKVLVVLENNPIPYLGYGIGLRREHFDSLLADAKDFDSIDFFEIAPENYMDVGGHAFRDFQKIAERKALLAHSLSLSIGSTTPIDFKFLKKLKAFLDEYKIPWMSDHLCISSVPGSQFYDLIPLALTGEMVKHVADRARQVQDFLERPLALENVSYYANLSADEMSEAEFVTAVVEEADCSLHLDVNNVFVNSVNHNFDPYAFIDQMPAERVIHGHMAGHLIEEEDWLIDTHGEPIRDEVWDLLLYTAKRINFNAILIERDFNIPPLKDVLDEMHKMKKIVEAVKNESNRELGNKFNQSGRKSMEAIIS